MQICPALMQRPEREDRGKRLHQMESRMRVGAGCFPRGTVQGVEMRAAEIEPNQRQPELVSS
jgi:hypothetical protein